MAHGARGRGPQIASWWTLEAAAAPYYGWNLRYPLGDDHPNQLRQASWLAGDLVHLLYNSPRSGGTFPLLEVLFCFVWLTTLGVPELALVPLRVPFRPAIKAP